MRTTIDDLSGPLGCDSVALVRLPSGDGRRLRPGLRQLRYRRQPGHRRREQLGGLHPGSGGTREIGGTTGTGGVKASGGATGCGGATSPGGVTGSGGASASPAARRVGRPHRLWGATASGGTNGWGGATGSEKKKKRRDRFGRSRRCRGSCDRRRRRWCDGDRRAGSAGSATVPSAGCGKASTLTFGMVPGENANAAAGSGNGVGHGDGGYVTIYDPNAGGTRGFALLLPDNYDKNKPYWLIFGFHWNGGNAAQVDNGGTNGHWWSYYGLQRSRTTMHLRRARRARCRMGEQRGARPDFVDDMVKLIEANYCVDTAHIITSGFSYGGGMSYEIACARAKVFHAAVSTKAGSSAGATAATTHRALADRRPSQTPPSP